MVLLFYVVGDAILFIVGLIITTIIIYVATHIMGERGGWGRAFLAAIIGFIVYYIFHALISGLLGALIGFIVWLYVI